MSASGDSPSSWSSCAWWQSLTNCRDDNWCYSGCCLSSSRQGHSNERSKKATKLSGKWRLDMGHMEEGSFLLEHVQPAIDPWISLLITSQNHHRWCVLASELPVVPPIWTKDGAIVLLAVLDFAKQTLPLDHTILSGLVRLSPSHNVGLVFDVLVYYTAEFNTYYRFDSFWKNIWSSNRRE